ncbi:MAG: type II toxin-antitoxin system HicB family antitoxin [Tepidiformaceae bacterium]
MREVLLSIHVEALPEGCFLATSDDLPGLVAQGRTVAETLDIARDVARALVESYQEHGDALPAAFADFASGDGNLRIPVTLG